MSLRFFLDSSALYHYLGLNHQDLSTLDVADAHLLNEVSPRAYSSLLKEPTDLAQLTSSETSLRGSGALLRLPLAEVWRQRLVDAQAILCRTRHLTHEK